MQLDFITLDVFTDRRFGGNQLAVVLDGRGLTTQQMQSIAAEFNLAETTFVLPSRDPAHTAEVRIFTPRAELPFAGHPNVGTAFVLATQGGALREPLVFEENAGLVKIDLIKDGASVVGARLAAPQPLVRGDAVAADIIAAACSVDVGDIDTANHAPCIITCGNPFAVVELKTRASLTKARPRADVFAERLPADRAVGILLYSYDQPGDVDIQVRMFAPLFGITEDSATGSGNVALAGFLTSLRPEPDRLLNLRIAQGVDMGRPSLLEAAAEKKNGEITTMSIGGRCVPVMRGKFEL